MCLKVIKYLESEIEILKRCRDHPGVLQLREVFETNEYVFMVTELADGGHLLDRVSELGGFCERDACDIMKQCVEAIQYIHSCGIVHRDLKPEV